MAGQPEPIAYQRLTHAGRCAVDRAHQSLTECWANEDYVAAVNDALAEAIAGHAVSINEWQFEPQARIVTLASSVHVDIAASPWMSMAIDHSAYDPRQRDPLANQAVLSDAMRRIPGWHVFEEAFLDPLGLADQLRATVYDGAQFVGHIAAFRARGDGRFTASDADILDALLPRVRRLLTLRGSVSRGFMRTDDLVRIVDAIGMPAFLGTTDGDVVHANGPARAGYRSRSEWLRPVLCGDVAPTWVERVPVTLAGDREWVLVFVRSTSFGSADCSDAPWARALGLPPKLAAVASGILRGLTDKEIGVELNLTTNSARTYVRRLFARTGVHSRTELLVLLTRGGKR